MPSRRIALLAACGVFFAGCGGSRERVYVDVNAIVFRADKPDTNLPTPKPPAGSPARTISLPAITPTSVTIGADDKVLRENLARAERELTRSLTREYLDEADREAATILGKIEPARAAALSEAHTRIRAVFERYANERAPKIARLASLVGFPDPNPNSVPPVGEVQPALQKLLDEAKRLRVEIAQLDAEYDKEARAILAQVESEFDVKLGEAKAEIAVQRSAAIDKAEAEAVKQAHEAFEAVRPALLGKQTVNMPGAPAQSTTLPAVPAPPSPPPVERKLLTAEEQRKLIREQLHVWSSARGYQLSETSFGARNATQEFAKWREERGL